MIRCWTLVTLWPQSKNDRASRLPVRKRSHSRWASSTDDTLLELADAMNNEYGQYLQGDRPVDIHGPALHPIDDLWRSRCWYLPSVLWVPDLRMLFDYQSDRSAVALVGTHRELQSNHCDLVSDRMDPARVWQSLAGASQAANALPARLLGLVGYQHLFCLLSGQGHASLSRTWPRLSFHGRLE